MSQRIFNQDGVAVSPQQAAPAGAAPAQTGNVSVTKIAKEHLINALRKTGHVSEEALEAVAEVAVRTLFGFAGE
jgi:hypothetical protein